MKSRLLALVLVAFQAACRPPAEPYAADVAIVHMIGKDEAMEKLRAVVQNAEAPTVMAGSVSVTVEYYSYVLPPYPSSGRGPITKKIYFEEVSRVEMWQRGGHTHVRVVGAAGKRIDQRKWSDGADAKLFADIVMSFHANPDIAEVERLRRARKKRSADEAAEGQAAPGEGGGR